MKAKLLLLLAVVLCFSACANAESAVSVSEETLSRPSIEPGESVLYVNLAAKRIHYHSDCRYLKNSKDENLTCIQDTPQNRETLLHMEYIPCENCSFPDYLNQNPISQKNFVRFFIDKKFFLC